MREELSRLRRMEREANPELAKRGPYKKIKGEDAGVNGLSLSKMKTERVGIPRKPREKQTFEPFQPDAVQPLPPPTLIPNEPELRI